MIELKRISLAFEEKSIFRDFSLALPESGVICFFGPSGCGKTTLFNLLAGLLKPQAGEIRGLEHKTVSYVFQSPRLLPWMSVLDNITLVRPGSWQRAEELLRVVGMEREMHTLPEELSGGMKQRVSIARALNYDGDLLLLDEPTNGLDAELAAQLWQYILKQYHERLVLMITHDRREAERYAEQVIELKPLQ